MAYLRRDTVSTMRLKGEGLFYLSERIGSLYFAGAAIFLAAPVCYTDVKKEETVMAKYTTIMNGNFDWLLQRITDGILNGSTSASLEEEQDYRGETSRCSIRVFERYSMAGGNRLSLTLVLYQEEEGPICVTGITAGGSQALFWKINTWGEGSFLDKLTELLGRIRRESLEEMP